MGNVRMPESEITNLDQQLQELVIEICRHPWGSLARQKGITKLIGLIQQSHRLWRDTHAGYEDALQQTWFYVCRHLCEAATGAKYDPEQSSVITWMNGYLKYRLLDLKQQDAIDSQKRVFSRQTDTGEVLDPIDQVPAKPEQVPILEEVVDWVQRECIQLRRVHIRDRPDVNCEVLILRRLLPVTPWEQLSREFRIPVATLSQFYRRECLPRLVAFGRSQGYLDAEP
ncbi:MAG: sigma-70 family RNA polymerase sigma factor [Leptolyngbyaceae cyanobacterium bins.59]|nr:sigma-70 family RNA polymerase sigma factor [Leptolyngbyaceae cyanobacterium bins.59]